MGRDNGTKDRPCAVVVAVKRARNDITVVVAPITHSPPKDPQRAVEIPAATKERLGLDSARSWLIADDLNYFTWPGPDLRPVPGKSGPDRFAYGFLPNAVTRQAIDKVRALTQQGKAGATNRND